MPQHEDQHFIREKIKEKPLNKKKILHKGIATIGYAALFGFVSCLVFCGLKPIIEGWFEPDQEQWVGIPKDTRVDDTNLDDTAADDSQETKTDEENGDQKKEKEEKKTVYITEKKSMTLDDYQILQNQLYRVGYQFRKSIVTVTGVKQDTDIFDLPYDMAGQVSGLIIGSNSKELLILTEYADIKDAETIHITFQNNDTANAALKKFDGNTGIAVLGVSIEKIKQNTMDTIEIAALGNSLGLSPGRIVVAVGNLLGSHDSVLTGKITSVSNAVMTEDHNYTIFTTNIMSGTKGNGVLINTNGEVVGLLLKSQKFQKEAGSLNAVSISELKDIIELLSNGKNIPYIGVMGSTVTDAISEEYAIPKGVYIKEAVIDSPGMTAGLQNGDVIAAIEGEEILTMDDYQQKLLSFKKGDEIKITVNRQGAKGYKKYNRTVKVGVLK